LDDEEEPQARMTLCTLHLAKALVFRGSITLASNLEHGARRVKVARRESSLLVRMGGRRAGKTGSRTVSPTRHF
jgi:hypothetical protein